MKPSGGSRELQTTPDLTASSGLKARQRRAPARQAGRVSVRRRRQVRIGRDSRSAGSRTAGRGGPASERIPRSRRFVPARRCTCVAGRSPAARTRAPRCHLAHRAGRRPPQAHRHSCATRHTVPAAGRPGHTGPAVPPRTPCPFWPPQTHGHRCATRHTVPTLATARPRFSAWEHAGGSGNTLVSGGTGWLLKEHVGSPDRKDTEMAVHDRARATWLYSLLSYPRTIAHGHRGRGARPRPAAPARHGLIAGVPGPRACQDARRGCAQLDNTSRLDQAFTRPDRPPDASVREQSGLIANP